MIKLLRANFSRMFKSRSFIVGIILTVGIASISVISSYMSMQKYPELYSMESFMENNGNLSEEELEEAMGDDSDPESVVYYFKQINSHESLMFNFGMYAMCVIPAIIGLFIGTDFSNGTIRNKLMVGHRRSCIYLANLITMAAGSVIIYLAGALISYFCGLICFKYSVLSAWKIIEFTATGAAITISTAAICTFLAMYFNTKAGGVASTMAFVMLMLLAMGSIPDALNSPPIYNENSYMNSKTEEVYELPQPLEEMSVEELKEYGVEKEDMEYLESMEAENPYYPRGIKRAVFKWIDKATPGCQCLYLSEWNDDRNGTSVIWSAFFVALSSTAGILIFRKRDLK